MAIESKGALISKARKYLNISLFEMSEDLELRVSLLSSIEIGDEPLSESLESLFSKYFRNKGLKFNDLEDLNHLLLLNDKFNNCSAMCRLVILKLIKLDPYISVHYWSQLYDSMYDFLKSKEDS